MNKKTTSYHIIYIKNKHTTKKNNSNKSFHFYQGVKYMSPHFLVRIICPMDLVGAVVNVDGIRLPKEIDTDPVMVNFVIFIFSSEYT